MVAFKFLNSFSIFVETSVQKVQVYFKVIESVHHSSTLVPFLINAIFPPPIESSLSVIIPLPFIVSIIISPAVPQLMVSRLSSIFPSQFT